MSEHKSSKYGWRVNEWCARHLAIGIRGTSANYLQLALDTDRPLPGSGAEAVIAQVRGQLRESLPQDERFKRFVLLRQKLAAVGKDQQRADVAARQADLERQRLLLAEYSDGQAQALLQAESQARSHDGTANSLKRLAYELSKELEAARTDAERALREQVERQRMAALEAAMELRDRTLAELARVAGPVLDSLAEALEGLRHSTKSTDLQMFDFRPLLDTIEVQGGDIPDVPPPPAPPPAANAEGSVAAISGVDAELWPHAVHQREVAPGIFATAHVGHQHVEEPAAEPTDGAATEKVSVPESPPATTEPARASRRRTPAKAE